jgi:hypothetical protein
LIKSKIEPTGVVHAAQIKTSGFRITKNFCDSVQDHPRRSSEDDNVTRIQSEGLGLTLGSADWSKIEISGVPQSDGNHRLLNWSGISKAKDENKETKGKREKRPN